MDKITVKAYAVKHKLSVFNVMKMVKTGTLKTESVDENGKEVTYIIVDAKIEEEVTKNMMPIKSSSKNELQIQIELLHHEVKLLKEEIDKMKKVILGL